ncbi:hypothetical protein V496_00741 [Pseudogymnoascus sp. VKM F-4515 (FW-2607)]|nr:hypothetical protein V496_00741 [Pseudogymnoascus sp. VKM F-4515 (FW-2607)]
MVRKRKDPIKKSTNENTKLRKLSKISPQWSKERGFNPRKKRFNLDEAHTKASTKNVEQLAFTIWRWKWATAYKQTMKKMKKVNTDPDFLNKLPLAIDENTGEYYEKIPPYLYFTKVQLAV